MKHRTFSRPRPLAETLCAWAVVGAWTLLLATVGLLVASEACTVQVEAPVPKPDITIECAVVDLGNGQTLRYCDAGSD
jgi:hypothetical protein